MKNITRGISSVLNEKCEEIKIEKEMKIAYSAKEKGKK